MTRVLLLLILLGLPAGSAAQPPAKKEALRLRMTPAQVRELLGPPTSISRRVILYRTHEQWHYAKTGLRLSFDHPRGLPAVLVRISGRE